MGISLTVYNHLVLSDSRDMFAELFDIESRCKYITAEIITEVSSF